MNSTEAKQIKIENFLQSIGIQSVRIYGKYIYYKAPYRNDDKPSFKVNTDFNTWYDIGTGTGGKIIDLVCLIYNCNVSSALNILTSKNIQSFSFSHSQTINQPDNLKIKHIQSIQNKALIQYLAFRKIPLQTALKYLTEAYYTTGNKQYFALAFKNDKAGHELRNKYFKGSTSPKFYTSIEINNSQSINIFEGFFNFLSALTFLNTDKPNITTIILNSLSFVKNTLPIIQVYKTVNLFLDNDEAGKQAVNTYQQAHPNTKNRALEYYPNHKDFNEFLCKP